MKVEDYSKIKASVGLFDASNTYGRLFARGKDAIDLLNRMSSNDITPLEKESGTVLTALLNEKGRFIDALKVVRDSKSETLLIISKNKEEEIVKWLNKFTIMEDARFEAVTENISQFLICGPNAKEFLSNYSTDSLDSASSTDVFDLHIDQVPATLVKAPSVAGDGWFILSKKENSEQIWNELLQGILALNGGIFENELFEVLRIENGMPISPNEINDKHNPLETPLAKEAVSFTKGCYIGQEVIARLDAQQKVQRSIVGLKFSEDGIEVGSRILDESLPANTPLGNEIGEVTSVAHSPKFGSIGLGYVRGKYANPGTVLSVKTEAGILPVTIHSLPFHA